MLLGQNVLIYCSYFFSVEEKKEALYKTPDAWKEAHVTPVFKKGEKYKAVNYRPVSLTCILCKQMEHILSSHIMEHLNTNHLLYDKQHGFRSKLSCETQLLEFTSDVLKAVQDKKQCDTVVMDFQ